MRCRRCETENDDRANFCEECGAGLEMLCWACGQPITLGKKFCRSCGAPLAGPPGGGGIPSPGSYTPRHLAQKILGSKAALEGERKQVTVLFADLKQSMELLADRDPEEARKILDPVLERMMEAIHRYEGTVNQVMGDGIMALFGAPIAHEDHAVRACYAALRMQEAVQRYAVQVEPVVGASVKIRVGLNSGQVVVRSIASDLRMDYSAVGETTHLAARMEQMAEAGSVLMTAATWRLAGPFVTIRALGPTVVRGLPEPVEIVQLVGAAPGRQRFHAAAAYGLTRFVGREGEIADLTSALDGAGAGQGRLVGVVGEPGIGKSRLVHQFIHSLRPDDWLVIEAGAIALDKATPYLPVVALLKSYFGIEEREEPEAIRGRLTAKLRALDHSLVRMVSPLLALLDVSVDDPQWLELAPEQRRRLTLDAVKDVLLRETEIRPVLVVLEDLQWMDSETDAVLERLVECLPMARLLVLVTYRPEYQHRWANKTYYTRLTVEPLPPDTASTLLDALLGDHVSVEPLKRLLIATTEGNPFFLEESVRMLAETSALAGSPGEYRLEREIKTLDVAPTVQAVLASRIDRLSPGEKRLLQSASIIGKDVPLAILRAVAEVGEEALRRALGHLQDAEFMYELRRFPEPEYTFKHALTHDVAYGSVLVDRRRALHARIVEAIEELYPGRLAEYAPVLAHHAVRGQVWPKAVEYLHQTASRAAGRSAHQEAVAHLEQAISALDRLPDSRQRTEVAIDLRCSLRNSLFAMGQHGQTLKYLNEAEELASGLQDRRRLGWVSCHLMVHSLLVGQYDRILAYGERARSAGKDLDDLPLQIVGNLGVGQAYHAIGQHRRALEALAQSVAPLEGPLVTQRFGMNSPPSVASHTWQAWCRAELGDFPLGLASGKEALRIAEAVKEPWSRAGARFGIGLVHLLQGDFPKAVAALASGLAICREFNLRTWFPPLASALGHGYCQAGDVTTGLPLIEEAVAQASSMGLIVRHSLRVCWLAEGQLATARLTQASDTAQLARRLATEHGEQGYVAWASRVLGAVVAESGRVDEAEEYYREAVRIAGDLEMRPLRARCHYDLGSLYSRVGRRGEARQQLVESVGLFQAMSMGYWTTRAERVLATLD